MHVTENNEPIIELCYSHFRITESFQSILNRLDLVCKTAYFSEYKHRSPFQVYLRVPHNVKTGDQVYCFIEPQINLSATARNNYPTLKLQLTICKYNAGFHSAWAKSKSIGLINFEHDDLIKYLGACNYWTQTVASFLYEQPQFEFDYDKTIN